MPMTHDEVLDLKRQMQEALSSGNLERAREILRSLKPATTGAPQAVELPQIGALAQVPLLAGLSREELLGLVREIQIRSVAPGEQIITQGADGSSVFCIAYGQVEVTRGAGVVRELVARLGPGEFFGEMAIVGRVPRLASVEATEPTGLFELTLERLSALAKQQPRVEQVLLLYYKERLLEDLVEISPVLRALDTPGRRAMLDRLQIVVVDADTALLREGEPGAGFYVLLRGRCSVSGRGPNASTIEYPDLGPGDVFGEISLVHGSPATASVQTTEKSVIIGLTRHAFDEIVIATPAARDAIMGLVDERLARTYQGLMGGTKNAILTHVL